MALVEIPQVGTHQYFKIPYTVDKCTLSPPPHTHTYTLIDSDQEL